MEKEKLITQKEYLAYDGLYCPRCKNDDIIADRIEADGAIGWSNVRCNNCRYTWQEHWKLTGYAKQNSKMIY